MRTENATPPLGEEEARDIINHWGGSGFFRLRNMGDKIFVDRVAPGAAYTIRLQTHYEQRMVRQVSEPYHGGPVDDRGRPPDPWQIPVRQPADFGERTELVPIPNTERVQRCPECAGQGRVTCGQCAGRGRYTCPWCGGTGTVEQQLMETGRDGQGNVVSVPRIVRRACGCAGGQVRCSGCSGNGIRRCPECDGSGRIKTFDQLVVRFQSAKEGELLDVTPVPDSWLGSLKGKILVEQRARFIERCDPASADETVPAEVVEKANALLANSHAVDEERARILLQLLHVERIPLHEVSYKYAGVERKLWICGKEQGIHAPHAPWNRKRLGWLIAGIVVAVVAVAVLIAYLLSR
jgi:hypothetical protein